MQMTGDREFYITSTGAGISSYRIQSSLIGQNDRALIYADNTEDIPSDIAEQMLKEFSERIFPNITNSFGPVSDIDNNQRVIIVLLDIQGDPNSGSGYIAGYFNPNDMFQNSTSNRGEILYVDVDPGLSNIDSLIKTIAHEFQHLVSHCKWHIFARPVSGETRIETWISEGLALAAEEIFSGEPLDNRIGLYYSNSGMVISSGNSFLSWGGEYEVYDYSSVYLFFHYLRAHAGTKQIYSDIFASQNRNYQAVTDVIETRNYPGLVPLIGSNDRETWQNLLGHFFAATVIQSLPDKVNVDHSSTDGDDLLGFKGFASLNPDSTLRYYPRESIVSYTDVSSTSIVRDSIGGLSKDLKPGDRIIAAHTQFVNNPVDPRGLSSELKYFGIDIDAVVIGTANRNIYSFKNPRLIPDPNNEVDILIAFNPNTGIAWNSSTRYEDGPPISTGAFPRSTSVAIAGTDPDSTIFASTIEGVYEASIQPLDQYMAIDMIIPVGSNTGSVIDSLVRRME